MVLFSEQICVVSKPKRKTKETNKRYFIIYFPPSKNTLQAISIESQVLSHGHELELGEEIYLVTRNMSQQFIFPFLIYMTPG